MISGLDQLLPRPQIVHLISIPQNYICVRNWGSRNGICKKDRRLVDVTITDKGLKLLEKLDNKQDKMDDILSNLSEKEASNLSKLLDKIRG